MKKPTAKLVVRREALRELASMELTRAAGGDDVFPPETGLKMCTQALVVPPAG